MKIKKLMMIETHRGKGSFGCGLGVWLIEKGIDVLQKCGENTRNHLKKQTILYDKTHYY